MSQVIHSIFDENIYIGTLMDGFFQPVFDRVYNAGDEFIQEMNNVLATIIFSLNAAQSKEYLRSVFLHIAIIIPYIIYSEYKKYKLEKRIYELTWTLNYQLRKEMFTVAPKSSKVCPGRSRLCNDVDGRQSVSSTTSTASARPRQHNLMEMGDMHFPEDSVGYNVKSTPGSLWVRDKLTPTEDIMVNLITSAPIRCSMDDEQDRLSVNSRTSERYSLEQGVKTIDEMYAGTDKTSEVPMSPAKKVKRESNVSNICHDSMFTREPSNTQTVIVEYCKVLRKKSPSGKTRPQSNKRSTSLGSNNHINATAPPKEMLGKRTTSKTEDLSSKWYNIIRKSNVMRNERLARLKEIELQKIQEKEKARKAEMIRRRAMIARIKEQNRKLLMEQKGLGSSSAQIADSGNEVVLNPLVLIKPADISLNNQTLMPTEFEIHGNEPAQCWNLAGQVPILRVTQRTVTIERTSKIRKTCEERKYNMRETRTLQIRDGDGQRPSSELQPEAVGDTPDEYKSNRKSEYFILPNGASPEHFVCVKAGANLTDAPMIQNKVSSAGTCRNSTNLERLRQVRSSLQQKLEKKPDDILPGGNNCLHGPWSPQKIRSIKPISNVFSSLKSHRSLLPKINAEGPELAPTRESQICQVKNITNLFEKRGLAQFNFKKCTSISAGRAVNVGKPIKDFDKNISKEENILNEEEHQESVNVPCSVAKERRPTIKRARRRLKKDQNETDDKISEVRVLEEMENRDDASLDRHLITVRNDSRADAAGVRFNSLIRKKLELRKQLVESLGAARCQSARSDGPSTEAQELVDGEELDTTASDGETLKGNRLKSTVDRKLSTTKTRRFLLDGSGSKSKLADSGLFLTRNRFGRCVRMRKSLPTNAGNFSESNMRKENLKALVTQDAPTTREPRKSHDRTMIASFLKTQERPGIRGVSKQCANRAGTIATPRQNPAVQTVEPKCDQFPPSVSNDSKNSINKTLNAPAERSQCSESKEVIGMPTESSQSCQEKAVVSSHDVTKASVGEEAKIYPEAVPVKLQESVDNDDGDMKSKDTTLKVVESIEPTKSEEKIRFLEKRSSEASSSKRADFLSYQNNDSGLPVLQSKTCRSSIQKTSSLSKGEHSQIHGQLERCSEKNTTSSSATKTLSESPQRWGTFVKNGRPPIRRQSSVDEREWNDRMKCWEKKRINLLRARSHRAKNSSVSRAESGRISPTRRSLGGKGTLELRKSDYEAGGKMNSKYQSFTMPRYHVETIQKKYVRGSSKEIAISLSQNTLTKAEYPPCNMSVHIEKAGCRLSTRSHRIIKTVLSPIQSESDNNNNNISSNSDASFSSKSKKRKELDGGDGHIVEGVKETRGFDELSAVSSLKQDDSPIDVPPQKRPSCRMARKQILDQALVSIQIESVETKEDSTIFYKENQHKPFSSHEMNVLDNDALALENQRHEMEKEVKTDGNEFSSSAQHQLSGKKKSQPKVRVRDTDTKSSRSRETDSRQKSAFYVDSDFITEHVSTHSERNHAKETTDSLNVNLQGDNRQDFRISDGKLQLIADPKRKKVLRHKKEEDLSGILSELLMVTQTLKEENAWKRKEVKMNKSGISDCISNDRALLAIVSSPLASSLDDFQHLTAQPIFVQHSISRRRVLSPVVVECVTTSPEEFFNDDKQTCDPCFNRSKDSDGGPETEFEWFEDFDYPPISTEELSDSRHGMLETTSSFKEIIIDRRGCKSMSEGHCSSGISGGSNYQVKRLEIRHDASKCHERCVKQRH